MNSNITASKAGIIAPYLSDIAKYQRMYQEEKARADWLRDQLSSLQLRAQDAISNSERKLKGLDNEG